MVITVSDSAGLVSALDSATGGERIELLAGDYESVLLKEYDFDTPVTITSADLDAPTVFGGRVTVKKSEGLNFENLHFHLSDDIPATWTAQFTVADSRDISIANVVLEGRIATTDDGPAFEDITPENYALKVVAEYPFGVGFRFRESEGVTLDNVDVSTVRIGISVNKVDGFELVNSHLHDIRSDGVNLSDVSDVRIADNLFDNFNPFTSYSYPLISDHPDFIQYWGTNSTSGIRGMEIAGNVFLQGAGGTTQAIYGRMNNHSGDIGDIVFTDLSIHDNLINTSHPNAIIVSDWHDVEVYDNTLLPAPKPHGGLSTTDGLPRILVSTDARPVDGGGYDLSRGILPENVTVEGNLVVGKRDGFGIRVNHLDAKELDALNVVIGDNALLSAERTSANFWGSLFPDLLDTPVSDISGLVGLDIGGVANIADWLIDVAAEIETVPATQVSGGDGDDVLVATDVGETLVGAGGDDFLTGGAGRDVLVGGDGDDTLTGGGRGDEFNLTAPPTGGHAVDEITDLDFGAGDYIILGEGFPRGFFDDDLDPDNSMATFAGHSGTVLDDDGDIEELLLSDKVEGITTESGDLELHFDFNGYGVVDYVLRLVGYAKEDGDRTDATTEEGGATDTASGDPVIDDDPPNHFMGGAGDDVITGAASDDVIEGAAGSDLLTGGDGADLFLFDVPADDGVDVDRISDLSFSEGDGVVLSISAKLDQLDLPEMLHLQVVDDGHGLLIDSADALEELASLGFASFEFSDDAVTIGFDIDGDGTAGYWLILQGDAIEGLEARLAAGATPAADPSVPTILGTEDSDNLFGTAAGEVIDGLGGRDVYFGGGGGDTLVLGDMDKDQFRGFDVAEDKLDVSAWGVQSLQELSIFDRAFDAAPERGPFITIRDLASLNTTFTLGEGVLSAADFTADNFVFADVADLEAIGTVDNGGEQLFGRAGNDVIDGGAGYNAMTGFGGDDRFVIGLGRGDVVGDFGDGADTLDLTAWGVSGLDDLTISESGGIVAVSDASRHLVRLEQAATGLSAADLTEESFIFADTLVA